MSGRTEGKKKKTAKGYDFRRGHKVFRAQNLITLEANIAET